MQKWEKKAAPRLPDKKHDNVQRMLSAPKDLFFWTLYRALGWADHNLYPSSALDWTSHFHLHPGSSSSELISSEEKNPEGLSGAVSVTACPMDWALWEFLRVAEHLEQAHTFQVHSTSPFEEVAAPKSHQLPALLQLPQLLLPSQRGHAWHSINPAFKLQPWALTGF